MNFHFSTKVSVNKYQDKWINFKWNKKSFYHIGMWSLFLPSSGFYPSLLLLARITIFCSWQCILVEQEGKIEEVIIKRHYHFTRRGWATGADEIQISQDLVSMIMYLSCFEITSEWLLYWVVFKVVFEASLRFFLMVSSTLLRKETFCVRARLVLSISLRM